MSFPSLFAVADAFTTETSNGTAVAQTWLKIEVNDLLAYSEQELGVEPEKIDEAISIIYHSYGSLNILEFLQFFALCKRADFGTFFGRTGPMQIASFLQRYLRRRNEEIANERSSEPPPPQLIEKRPNERKEYIELRIRARNGDQEAIKELRSYIHHD